MSRDGESERLGGASDGATDRCILLPRPLGVVPISSTAWLLKVRIPSLGGVGVGVNWCGNECFLTQLTDVVFRLRELDVVVEAAVQTIADSVRLAGASCLCCRGLLSAMVCDPSRVARPIGVSEFP